MGQLFSSIMQYLFPNREYKIVMVGACRSYEASLVHQKTTLRFQDSPRSRYVPSQPTWLSTCRLGWIMQGRQQHYIGSTWEKLL